MKKKVDVLNLDVIKKMSFKELLERDKMIWRRGRAYSLHKIKGLIENELKRLKLKEFIKIRG